MNIYLIIRAAVFLFLLWGFPSFADDTKLQHKKVTGTAKITSQIDGVTFRDRAMENAIQKLTLGANNKLKSFSLIENGKLLVDQIQSYTDVHLLDYKILNESKKNGTYYVDIAFIYTDEGQETIRPRCLELPTNGIKTAIKIRKNSSKLPAWATIDDSKILNKILSLDHAPKMTSVNETRTSNNANQLYTLTKSVPTDETYLMRIDLSFDYIRKNNLIEKKTFIVSSIKIETFRNNTVVFSSSEEKLFEIENKNFLKLSLGSGRKSWGLTEEDLNSFIFDHTKMHAETLNCIDIQPELKVSGEKISIDFGFSEGIKPDDWIVAKGPNGRDIFLKVKKLGKYSSSLQLVSKIDDLANINLAKINIVSGS
jgi:hypothetical protein